MADNNSAKVRSPSQEKALDEKIEQIQRKNKELEERSKVRQSEAKQVHQVKSEGGKKEKKDVSPKAEKKEPVKAEKNNNNDRNSNGREWDTGKTPAEQWKMNVPEFGDGAATSRRRRFPPGNNRRRPNPRPGFQHDDRFAPNGEPTEQKEGEENVEGGNGDNARPPRKFNNRRRGPRQPRASRERGEAGEGEVVAEEGRRPPPNRRPKKDIFDRVTKADENGETVPFRGQRPRRGPPRPITARRPNENRARAPRSNNDPKRRSAASESGENGEKPVEGRPPRRHPNGRRPRPQNSEEKVEGGEVQTVKKRKVYKPRPNRPVPDKVQVRQVVRQMVGRVCAEERREKKGLAPAKETEL